MAEFKKLDTFINEGNEYKHINNKENAIKLAIKDVEKKRRLKVNRDKPVEYEQLSLNKIMLSKVLGREKLGKEHQAAWKKLMKEYDLKESVNEGTVTFTIDDGKLDDKFMGSDLSKNLDYKKDGKDTYYVLSKRDYDRFLDYADSNGFDTEKIDVIDEDATPANVNGMGSISMPGIGDSTVGSGDIPHDLGATATNESSDEDRLKELEDEIEAIRRGKSKGRVIPLDQERKALVRKLKTGTSSYVKRHGPNKGKPIRESFLKFNKFINEAASWGVNVEEPFSDKAERKAQDKFVIKIDPIKVAGSSGFISEDETEVYVQLTNGDEIYYAWVQKNGDSAEAAITVDRKEHPISQKSLDKYLGSTGTVVGDMLLMYRDFYFKGQGTGSL